MASWQRSPRFSRRDGLVPWSLIAPTVSMDFWKNQREMGLGSTVVFSSWSPRFWITLPATPRYWKRSRLKNLLALGSLWRTNIQDSGNRWIPCGTRTTLKNSGAAARLPGSSGELGGAEVRKVGRSEGKKGRGAEGERGGGAEGYYGRGYVFQEFNSVAGECQADQNGLFRCRATAAL